MQLQGYASGQQWVLVAREGSPVVYILEKQTRCITHVYHMLKVNVYFNNGLVTACMELHLYSYHLQYYDHIYKGTMFG